MALAATLSAGGMRPASFLPSIKCSSCGNEIEISAMGDHTCAKAPPSPRTAPAAMQNPNPFASRQFSGNDQRPAQPSPLQYSSTPAPQTRLRAPTLSSNQTPAPRAPRPTPPWINPDAANKPFLSPISRAESPISPASSVRSGSSNGARPLPLRSQTSPMPRLWDPRPPSPEFTANIDCAFPHFPPPSSNGSRPSTRNGRSTPAGSERASSPSGSRQDGRFLPELESRSPISNPGENNVMQRMNIRTAGPFDAGPRRPSKDDKLQYEPTPLDRRRPSIPKKAEPEELPPRPSTSSSNYSIPRASTAPPSIPAMPRPSTSVAGHRPLERKPSEKKVPPQRPVRPTEEVLSPTFLDKFSSEPAADALPLSKMPSEPALRCRERRPTLTTAAASESQIPQVRPRSSSTKGNRIDYRMHDAPPVPKPVQLTRQNSFHRPSESGSSTASSAQSVGNSNSSSGPSPVGSAASSVDADSPLTSESGPYGDEQAMRVAGLNVKHQQKPGMRAEQPKDMSPARNFARPSPPKEHLVKDSPTLPSASNWPLESPTDPAMQNAKAGRGKPDERANVSVPPLAPAFGLSAPNFPSSEYDPYRPASPQSQPQQRPQLRARSKTNMGPQAQPSNMDVYSEAERPQLLKATAFSGGSARSQTRSPAPLQPPPIPQDVPRAAPLARRGTVAKQACRGCGHQIEGKSVKAADGRLTGRWHKQCFVCKTCEQPFTTADFYVIKNHPYCEHHYHEKNGSLCHGCNRGIEGQYLETTSGGPAGRVDRKYHPRCFTCIDCRTVLSDEYFEIGGRVYCERHALAAMRGPPARVGGLSAGNIHGRSGLAPGLTAERRTTKLMMM